MTACSSLSQKAFGQARIARELVIESNEVKGLLVLALLAGLLLPHAYRLFLRKSAGLRSWSSEKFSLVKGNERITTGGGFISQFPPSRREALLLAVDADASRYKLVLRGPNPSATVLQTSQLPSTRIQDLEKPGQYTPTGFSTTDIKALGRFPDYAVLSGVPYPKPCPDFDIQTACFRPFRPFRWAYHQTMCS